MPTTILDGETYPEALRRRFTEEAADAERMQERVLKELPKPSPASEWYDFAKQRSSFLSRGK